jgi:hypothetical protein
VGTPASRSTPVLVVAEGPSAKAAREALARAGIDEEDAQASSRATALALAALTPAARERTLALVTALADRLEIRANPFAEDLDEEPIDSAAREALRLWGPSLTASSALAAHVHASGDGHVAVALAPACPPAEAPVVCVPSWNPDAEDPRGDRARFLAWPWAFVGVLSVPERRDEALTVLRDRLSAQDSTLALALAASDLEGEAADAWRVTLRAEAGRALRFAKDGGGAVTKVLERLAQPATPSRVVPWLRLSADEVLVVPKLGASGQDDRFAREVEGELVEHGLHPRWVHRPVQLVR